jgi:divalent metal cation (Fe/Co/Zn/Cd) transporter
MNMIFNFFQTQVKRGGMNQATRDRFYKVAYLLAIITIAYNIIEGAVSVWFGAEDRTLSLFGFGIDSFVEVISGIGIWHMVRRIRSAGGESKDTFERLALRITGWAFFLLTAGLVVSSGLSIYEHHRPDSTVWGIIVSLVSIACMWLLIHYKIKVGAALDSPAILADAACSRVCLQLSLVLLAASTGYELTGIGGFDAVGALLIAFLAFREGREALRKAKGLNCCCGGNCKS